MKEYSLLKGEDGNIKLVCEHFVYKNRASSPEDIYRFMSNIYNMQNLAVEKTYMLIMDGKNQINSVILLGQGSATACPVPVREALVTALLCNAVGVALVHNHPSGDITPSDVDIVLTNRMKSALDLVGIRFIDHMIIGEGTYYSFNTENML